jgi:hypothetical protein
MLAHDLINKIAAIVANCDQLETEVPDPGCLDRTEKIKELATGMADTLLSRKCELRELRTNRPASVTTITNGKTM